MCYTYNNKRVNLDKALQAFNAEALDDNFKLEGNINAFAKKDVPDIPAIVNKNGILLMNTFWGTQQHPDKPTKGKNLQSENTHTYYKKIQNNRCLIPASSYFESKEIFRPNKRDPNKQVRTTEKYEMWWKDKEQFYIAAFYDFYADGNLGFGLVTTIPNPVQAEIHKRMIITLDEKAGIEFLNQEPIEKFQYPNYSPNLEFVNLDKTPQTLF